METTSGEPPSGRVVVQRDSAQDMKIRQLFVFVDDFPERVLRFGEELDFDLGPGRHKIKVTNRLFSQRAEFDLAQGETLRFGAANVAPGCLFAPLTVLGGAGAYRVTLVRN